MESQFINIDQFIQDNWKKMTHLEMAKVLGVSRSLVSKRCMDMNLRKNDSINTKRLEIVGNRTIHRLI